MGKERKRERKDSSDSQSPILKRKLYSVDESSESDAVEYSDSQYGTDFMDYEDSQQDEDEIECPQLSSKEYKSLQLDNGLEVLLVSDLRFEIAAAAMLVKVGSLFDPVDIPGMAHLLEHVLFRGSDKFADHEYQSFLSENGGESNASTELEHTLFKMKVGYASFEQALYMFSRIFVAPLLDSTSVQEEVSMVDAEHSLCVNDDSFRLHQFKGHIAVEKLFNRFTAGNKSSLSSQSLSQRLRAFFDEYFIACSMKLVVVGAEPLSTLEDWVRDFFGKIKTSPVIPELHLPSFGPLWNAQLLYNLKSSVEDTYDWSRDKYEMVSLIYEYIKLLSSTPLQEWVMKEYLLVKSNELDGLDVCGEGADPFKYATSLAENMMYYGVKQVIVGSYRHQWDPEGIKDLIQFFVPENMRLILLLSECDSFKGKEAKVEPWYHSLFYEEHIPPHFIERWKKPAIHPFLAFPQRNLFLPYPFDPYESYDEVAQPVLLGSSPVMKIYYYRNGESLSHAFFGIHLKIGTELKDELMAELFVELLKDALFKTISQAQKAGLHTTLKISDERVLKLKVHGFRGKLPPYLSVVWKTLLSLVPNETPFKIIKQTMLSNLANQELDIEYLSCTVVHQVLGNSSATNNSLEILQSITLSDLISFIPDLLSKIFVEGICFGDMSETDTQEIIGLFEETVDQGKSLDTSKPDNSKVLRIPHGGLKKDLQAKMSQPNSLAKVYFQIFGKNEAKLQAKLYLLDNIISENLFHQLRGIENLGYLVRCRPQFITSGSHGFEMSVTSSKYNPRFLAKRICTFTNNFLRTLEAMSDETFKNHKSNVSLTFLKASELVPGKEIWKQMLWKRSFDFPSKVGSEVSSMKKDEFIQWFKRKFKSSRQRRLIVGIWAGSKLKEYKLRMKKLSASRFSIKAARERSRKWPMKKLSASRLLSRLRVRKQNIDSIEAYQGCAGEKQNNHLRLF